MTLAITPIEHDPFLAWQAANDAAYCERLRATITQNHCNQQRYYTRAAWSDCRCNGCGGLFNQDEPKAVRTNRALLRSIDKMIAISDQVDTGKDKQQNGLIFLDEIIDELYTNPIPGDDFDDVELDLDDEQLLALFPELAEDDEADLPLFTERMTKAPRRSVFKGRCKRCGGYVEDTRERFDDDVFHCLQCGWRTSPEYERNRQINSARGVL